MDSLCQVMGDHLSQYPKTYLCGLDPSRGRDTHIGLDYKRPKRVSGGKASPTGFICVCGPGLVGKMLLHRVGISLAPLVVSGCHFGE